MCLSDIKLLVIALSASRSRRQDFEFENSFRLDSAEVRCMMGTTDDDDEGYGVVLRNGTAMKLFIITFASFTAKSIYNGVVFSAYIFLLMDRRNTAVGFLAGMSGLIGMIMAPIVGVVSDKWDRAQFLRSSALFGATAVVVAAYAVSQNMYSLMMVSEVVWGFFWAISGL